MPKKNKKIQGGVCSFFKLQTEDWEPGKCHYKERSELLLSVYLRARVLQILQIVLKQFIKHRLKRVNSVSSFASCATEVSLCSFYHQKILSFSVFLWWVCLIYVNLGFLIIKSESILRCCDWIAVISTCFSQSFLLSSKFCLFQWKHSLQWELAMAGSSSVQPQFIASTGNRSFSNAPLIENSDPEQIIVPDVSFLLNNQYYYWFSLELPCLHLLHFYSISIII